MTRYWMLVVSKNHVAQALKNGIAQACHGKAYPLKRMQVNDGIIFYSPKIEFGKEAPCQEFTAVGTVTGTEVYAFDMGNGFIPFRRDMIFMKAKPTPIKPLIEHLHFISDKKKWGAQFRFGAFEIPEHDFMLITKAMEINH